MGKTYVYALDLALNSTGVCIFTDDGKFVDKLTVDTNKLENTQLKLKLIGETFLELIEKYEPSVVVIEEGFSRYNRSTQQLFRTHGLVNYIFADYPQEYYPSTTVKKVVGGKGNIKKEELRRIINMEHPEIIFDSLDESDAFSVGKTYFLEKRFRDA